MISYSKNEVSGHWEFMILDTTIGTCKDKKIPNLGPFDIDPDLKSLTVVDNAN